MIARKPGESFADAVRADPRFRKMADYYRQPQNRLDVDKLNQELISLQAGRKFPKFKAHVVMSDVQRSLTEASQETAAINSRASHIKMIAHVKKRRLDRHLHEMKRYLAEMYASSLRATSSTIKGREESIRDVLRPFYTLSYDLETLIGIADILLTDLTRSGYAMDLDYRLAHLSTRPERSI